MRDPDEFGRGRSSELPGAVSVRDPNAQNVYYPQEGYFPEDDGGGFNFWEAVQIVLSRKWMVLALTLLGVVLAGVLTLRADPMYRASATIEIQREETRIMEGASVDPVVVADAEYMATQYQLLQSRSLSERVADLLDLPSDERYADQDLPRPARLQQAANVLVTGLRVSPEGRSRVVNVEFVSPHQFETARIANAIVENFIESNLERKFNTTAYARKFLEERLATTKTALEEKERELVEYAENEGILELATGENGSTSLSVNSVVALNDELARAESERIAAEQILTEAQANAVTREMMDSTELRRLRERRSDLVAEYEEKLGTFKEEFPAMIQLKTRIASVDSEIETVGETLRASVVTALGGDYRAALSREQSLRLRVQQLTSELQEQRNRRIQYTILQREVDTNRSQYDALLQRLKEVSISSGVGSSQVSVVDRALAPTLPFEPNVPRTLIQALILSLAAGIGLAFALNYIDDTIKTPEDVRTKLGLTPIGIIPKVGKNADLVSGALADPKSTLSEAFLSARTALEFSTRHGTPKSLLLTSTRPGEGKTSSTISLARAYAKIGRSVLIIDADMRKPSFVSDREASIGLSGLLTQDVRLEETIVRSSIDGLSLLPSGIVPPNPAELLSGRRLREIIEEAEAMFDIVIVDSPPVLSFADGPLLGSVCEGTLIVVQAGQIRRPAVERTIQRMMESRSNVIGAILMRFDAKQAGYDYGYYYSAYGSSVAYVERDGASDSARRKIRIQAIDDGDASDQPERFG